jgi:hypothetical protein
VYSVLKSRLITDWSVGNMNPDMNLNIFLLNVRRSSKREKKDTTSNSN